MTNLQIGLASLTWVLLIYIVYHHVGWKKIIACYQMWFSREYWTNYNIVEAISWLIKAIIIIPGLIFKIQIWWLYLVALFTSLSLIWASNKKLMPTLVGFNTLWVWLACMVLAQNLI